MRFWKMNGAGNDFVVLNNLEEHLPVEVLPQVARTLCERHLSIGADGLMVVDAPTQGGDYKMLFFNSDGSVGEMCGNGARCICRYGYENGLAGEVQTVETTAGIVTGRRELGRKLRAHPVSHKGANATFYASNGEDTVYERTFERGVEDFTYACGTGTGSVVTVLTLQGKVSGKNVKVDMTGGQLIIDVERENGGVTDLFLTGPTNNVAKGEVTDEDHYLAK